MALRTYQGENEKRNATRGLEPRATITKDGYIRLNKPLIADMPNLRRVRMMADMEAEPAQIVLKLLREDEDARFVRTLTNVSGGLHVKLKGFLGWCGVDFEKRGTTQYPARYDEKMRAVVIRLEA